MYILLYNLSVMHRYSVAECRAHLPSIIERAEAGEAVEITRRGRPVAVIVSREEFERLRSERPAFAEVYRAFLKKFSLAEVGLDADFAASVRDRSPGRRVKL
jgi:prevent-host-death family protein